jgi:N-carbamoyl-L-amino-acid hydrolase
MDLLSLKPMAERLFDEVRKLSFDGVGVTRESYGRGESAAAAFLRDIAQEEGLQVETDRAANLLFRLPGKSSEAPSIWCGSHMDSVPQGGNYDGLAGIVAGLLCLVARKRAGHAGVPDFRVIAFRGEESAWFGKAYMGSGALFGKLGPEDLELKQRNTGATLASCMLQAGADVEAIRAHQPLFAKESVRAYLELHIEQGPVMVARELPLGVVSGIRGNVRHNRITCTGEAGHSGAVPRWLRRDAMFAVADLIMRLDEHWRALLERGIDLVVTTGVVSTDAAEHSISRIPGRVGFSFEARSKSLDTLEGFYELLRAECKAIGRDRRVSFEFDRRMLSDPATMDPRICDILSRTCKNQGTPFEVIASGAGHDASLFANAGIPSGMLFIRNRNGSHNPDEAMDIDDFMPGVQVLSDAVEQLA